MSAVNSHGIDEYSQLLVRTCQECAREFQIGDFLTHFNSYFFPAHNYRMGCDRFCLGCWLGVGSGESLPAECDENEDQDAMTAVLDEDQDLEGAEEAMDSRYQALMKGDLLKAYSDFFDLGAELVVLPIDRLHLDRIVRFPHAVAFFPVGAVDLSTLNVHANRRDSGFLSESQSATSGVDLAEIGKHPLVVFPCRLGWAQFVKASHNLHMDLLRYFSSEVDRRCLDFIRFRTCKLGSTPNLDLPAKAGQTKTNKMMAGAVVYCGTRKEARLIAGHAFSHYLTRGLGLCLEQLEWDTFPQGGEVGNVVSSALGLFSALLESPSPTSRFMQAFNLLEFLGDPDQFKKFRKLKGVIIDRLTIDRTEHQRIGQRFIELTRGVKDSAGQIAEVGIRTKIVHLGKRIEDIVPSLDSREKLFLELDEYIRPTIEHMISHSHLAWSDYQAERERLCPDWRKEETGQC